ncbi:MAG TPA: hypothetical protein VF407_24785 [Polyangiaceae bacterium]
MAFWGCGDANAGGETASTSEDEAALQNGPSCGGGGNHGPEASVLAKIDSPIAGVAGDDDVVFVGEALDGAVTVVSRATGKQIGFVPAPPGGFALPLIMHTIGPGKIAILAAGGLPQPDPFTPADPIIYEYSYSYHHGTFAAKQTRAIDFSSAFIGFSEDFVKLDDGRYLLSDAILGSVWIAEKDGTIKPGIVPKTFDPSDAIPELALCPTMPEVTVNGYPFLFSGSTLPGVSPLAVKHGTVYYFSPCGRGIYSFPLAALSDHRQPWQRARDIRLVASTPKNVKVEELLDFTFNPYDPSDDHLYAADPLALAVIRVDIHNGRRETLASGATLFDFPSSLGFLPQHGRESTLVVASNQQERTPLTNDAVTDTTFNFPFIVAQIKFDAH